MKVLLINGSNKVNGTTNRALEEVAKELNISRSYGSRIEKRVIETIRNEFTEQE